MLSCQGPSGLCNQIIRIQSAEDATTDDDDSDADTETCCMCQQPHLHTGTGVMNLPVFIYI